MKKCIKKYWLWWAIVIIVLGTIAAIVVIKTQKKHNENPELIPIKKDYNIKVELSDEQEMEYETNVLDTDRKINEYFYGTGQKDENYKLVFGSNEQLFINKATNLKYLGRYNEAIETFQEIFRRYKDSIYALNNLAIIYEEVKEYELAIKLYQKIQEKYPQYALDALYKITQLYTFLGDKDAAGKSYISYELSGGQRDEGLMEAIRQLK